MFCRITCLIISYPKGSPTQTKRLDLRTERYTYEYGIVHGYGRDYSLRTEEGYWYDYMHGNNWYYLLLFGDDAIMFLSDVLRNPTAAFDLLDIVPSEKEYLEQPMVPLTFAGDTDNFKPYTEEEIKVMLREIK